MSEMHSNGKERFTFLYGEQRSETLSALGREKARAFLRSARESDILPLPLKEYISTVVNMFSAERDDPMVIAFCGELQDALKGEES